MAAALLLVALPTTTLAEPSVGIDVERHATSNALDGPLSDTYTLLRGTFRDTAETDLGTLSVAAEARASFHDRATIEDDRSAGVELSLLRRIGDRIELKGTLGLAAADTGDDLSIGGLVIGTRAASLRRTVALQGGVDLGDGWSAVMTLGSSRDATGPTRFQDALLPAQRLDADENRLTRSLQLTQQTGAFAKSVQISLTTRNAEALGDPPVALDFEEYTLRGAVAHAVAGYRFELAAGLQQLEAELIGVRFTRPAASASVSVTLPFGIELSSRGSVRFETANTDDPLGSYLRRGEMEARLALTERLEIGAGAFAEAKDNLLLENVEYRNGIYAALSYGLPANLRLTGRVDYAHTYRTVLEERWSTLDAFVGLGRRL